MASPWWIVPARRGPAPAGETGAVSGAPAPRSRTPGLANQGAIRLAGLAAVGHVLGSRRFYERMAVAAIVLGALRRIGQENQASTMERLAAWNRREIRRLERKAEHQARVVKGARRMTRSKTRRA